MTREEIVEVMRLGICQAASVSPTSNYGKTICARNARAALAALETRGTVVVPTEPTQEMIKAGDNAVTLEVNDIYLAMVDARPK